MTPAELVRCIDFRYITDALTPNEALEILTKLEPTKAARTAQMLEQGFPAYTTGAGWLGYSDDKVRRLCREALAQGFKHIKVKVGRNLEADIRRAAIIREEIGWNHFLMLDANQVWDVQEAIDWMQHLVVFKPIWIEEPTSPDDILGHATIARAMQPHGIGVATGEMGQNRVLFKQLLQAEAISFCQIDATRVGGVNENLAVLLMCAKFDIPVCPHAGGVGLCEYVQHLSIFDYIAVSGSLENRVIEFADHLHQHFLDPCVVQNGHYLVPSAAGYSAEIRSASLEEYEFPNGLIWRAA
jgi:L-fuconate dehydratase